MGRRIEITTVDGTAQAYLCGSSGSPGVLLFVDAIGLRPRIEEMADRIAAWGYLVLAPHVFYRDGSAAELAPRGDLRDTGARDAFFAGGAMDRVRRYTPDRSRPDTDAWMQALLERAGPGPVGAVGYCMGARLAVLAAGRFPGTVAAVGGFHAGGLVSDEPDSPHLSIAASTAEFAFGHADQDLSMPLAAVATLEETLVAAQRPHVNEIYAGAAHGYSMADTSAYDEAATARHFTALQTLFARTLVASAP